MPERGWGRRRFPRLSGAGIVVAGAVGNGPYPNSQLRTPTLVFEGVLVAGV